MELADLFPENINPNDPFFQAKITAKKEFQDLATDTTEEIPSVRGQLFKHQQMFKRYMQINDRIMVIAEPGTGKTCTVGGLAEFYADHVGETPIRRTYVLVHSSAVENEIRYQLICRCSDGRYETKKVKESQGQGRQRNITTSIQKWYEIQSYRTFASKLRKKYWKLVDVSKPKGPSVPDLARLEYDFSGSIFWMDEIHELRISRDVLNIDDTLLKKKEITYKTLWTLFHCTKRCKYIETTATPMINHTRELGPPMNLILPIDKQFPFNYDFDTATLEQMNKRLSGSISYIRALDTGINVIYEGQPIGGRGIDTLGEEFTYQEIVYPTAMSKLQESCYLRYRGNNTSDDIDDDAEDQNDITNTSYGGTDVYTYVRQATNFVYPDGDIGMASFNKYIGQDKVSKKYYAREELNEYLRNIRSTPENGGKSIETLSCKYADIIERAKYKPGCFFVQSDFSLQSGIIQFALCLEAQGYGHFDQNTSAFERGDTNENQGYCNEGLVTKTEGERRLLIPKGLRYAIVDSNTTSSRGLFSSIMELFNSKENRHGEYIKFILVSMVGRTGLSFNNVIEEDLLEGFWNKASNKQTKMRCIRATSHAYLIREKQQRGDFTRVNVQIFQHVAVTRDGESINIRMYKVSERKERAIGKKMRQLKQIAFDCWLNVRRNIRPGDIDGTPECDYTTCDYKCYNPDPRTSPGFREDVTSYDVLYTSDLINSIMNDIFSIMREHSHLTLNSVYYILKLPEKYVNLAIERIITSKTPFQDRYGFYRYLHESSGWIYLSDTFDKSKVMDTFYVDNLIAIEHGSISKVDGNNVPSTSMPSTVQSNIQTLQSNLGISNVMSTVIGMTTSRPSNSKMIQLENELVNYRDSNFIGPMMDKLKNFWFKIVLPKRNLQQELDVLRISSQGRKAKKDPKMVSLNSEQLATITYETEGPEVIVHNFPLYETLSGKGQGYGNIQVYYNGGDRFRILDGNRFRYTDLAETIVYNHFHQKIAQEKIRALEANKIYIIKMGDKEIIRNVFDEKDDGNLKDKNRGRNCTTIPKTTLLEMTWYARAPPSNLTTDTIINNMDELTISNRLDTEQLFGLDYQQDKGMSLSQKRWMYLWTRVPRINNPNLCIAITSKLKQDGMIFEVYPEIV